jgi:hypothetical protein
MLVICLKNAAISARFSVCEDYYQELQKGMICCGILDEADTAMACFRGGLNREIQDILDYKEYADMT